MTELFYFNTDFDFSLSAAPEFLTKVTTVARRKELLFWSLGAEDRYYLPQSEVPPATYAEQIKRYGLTPLKPLDRPLTGAEGRPWGWNQESLNRLVPYCQAAAIPNPAVVKEANSRLTAWEISKDLDLLLPGSRLVHSFDETMAVLAASRLPVVVKPLFGNAGIGLSIITAWPLNDNQKQLLAENLRLGGGSAIIEPWLQRVDDFSTYYELAADGRISGLNVQRCLVGQSGSFYGMLLERGLQIKRPELQMVARAVAAALHSRGYTGPVIIDGYTYKTASGQLRYNFLTEINARQTMGLIARHLLESWPDVNAVLFRLGRRKRCTIPATMDELDKLLGNRHYQTGAARGLAVLTPLAAILPRSQVLQNLFAIAGHDSLDCLQQLADLEKLVFKSRETFEINQRFSLL